MFQRWRLDQLWSYDLDDVRQMLNFIGAGKCQYVANAIRHKNRSRCTALLRGSCYVCHANTNYETDDWTEKSDDRIAGNTDDDLHSQYLPYYVSLGVLRSHDS